MKGIIFTLFFALIFQVSQGQNIRNYDGSGNNTKNPTWGMIGTNMMIMSDNGYSDSMSMPAGLNRPNPRVISNAIFSQPVSLPNQYHITDFGWAFGQFMDHDLTLVFDDPVEELNIPVPAFDPDFDPAGTGNVVIPMKRSKYDPSTGTSPSNPRKHINDITAWIDASNVYGSDQSRADWLRTFTDGKLKTSTGNLLPFNTITGEYSDPIDPSAPFMIIDGPPMPIHFIAGDVRANEQPILTSLHTLFLREHNRICDMIKKNKPGMSDEMIYQYARKVVSGMIQNIAYTEWLPALGIQLDAYFGYDQWMEPTIMNEFSAAAFRLGHTLINGDLMRLDEFGNTHPSGNIRLKDAFFQPMIVKDQGGVEPFFRGMAKQEQQNFDAKVVDDLRNFLFGPPGAGGLDLVSININRGRERGLPDYNTLRSNMGLAKYTQFSQITSDINSQQALANTYGSIDQIDPWVGMLSEDHIPGAAVGELIHDFLKVQFTHLREGDRFYFENDAMLSQKDIDYIKESKFSDIIMRNTTIDYIQPNVFKMDNAQACNTPKNLRVKAISSTSATLEWDKDPVADWYTITGYRSGKPNVAHLIVNKTTKTVKNLKPGSEYIWQVQAICDGNIENFSLYSSLDTFETSPLQSVRLASYDQNDFGTEIGVYPNPNTGTFNITIPEMLVSDNIEIVITDLKGAVVHQAEIQSSSENEQLSISNQVTPGLYLLQVKGQENTYQTRLLISN